MGWFSCSTSTGKKVGLGKTLQGKDLLETPKHNQGCAYSQEERELYGLKGLLPAAHESMELQVRRCLFNLDKKTSNIEKYVYLMGVLERNQELFYRVLVDNVTDMMPLVYTPTVGQACQEYSEIFTKPRGLYVTIKDKGYVDRLIANWPEDNIKAIVFTDGERILGLGDLGVNGMGIPCGKLQLYSACAGINPNHCLPVQIDVGTNNENLLNDEFYQGLRQKRVRGKQFEELIEEFMSAAVKRWGRNLLLQFEDFGNSTAFGLLENTRERYCTFNDDIQGTAVVAVAGMIASLRSTSSVEGGAKSLADHTFLFSGAGEAGTGIANLIAYSIVEESGGKVSLEEARKQIWMVDSKGLITKKRTTEEKLAHHKLDFAHELSADATSHLVGTEFEVEDGKVRSLEQAVQVLTPTALVGVSAVPQTFTQSVLEHVAENCPMPLVFALSNPTSKAECTAEQAYTFTDGKAIFASGSPFAPVEYNGKTYESGQGNNAYVFPGLGLGVIACQATIIPDEIMYTTAQALAEQVSDQDLERGSLYPRLDTIRDVSLNIAVKVAEKCYEMGIATHAPKPSNLKKYIRSQMHFPGYP